MLDINWWLIPDVYKFAAMDSDGAVYVYSAKPSASNSDSYWDLTVSDGFADFLIRTKSHPVMGWKDTLTERKK